MKNSSTTGDSKDIALEQSYILAEHWKSDLEFYKVELVFLNSLINKYFVWLIKDNDLSNIKVVAARLEEITKINMELIKEVIRFMFEIKEVLEGSTKHNHSIQKEHIKLAEELTTFLKSFRAVKKDIFKITETVMQHEKIKKLIS